MGIKDLAEQPGDEESSGMIKHPDWRVWLEPTVFYTSQDDYRCQIVPKEDTITEWWCEIYCKGSTGKVWESLGTVDRETCDRIGIPLSMGRRINKALRVLNTTIGVDWRNTSKEDPELKRESFDGLWATLETSGLPDQTVHHMTNHTNPSVVKVCPECDDSTVNFRKTKSPRWRCSNGHEFSKPKWRKRRN